MFSKNKGLNSMFVIPFDDETLAGITTCILHLDNYENETTPNLNAWSFHNYYHLSTFLPEIITV